MEFLRELTRRKIAYSEVRSLPRIILVESERVAFPLPHLAESVEEDSEVRGASEFEVALTSNLSGGGSWGVARHIRRRAPWPTRRLQFPWTTYYRCARDGTGVDVYSLDTGLRTTHEQFSGRATMVWEGVSSGGVGDNNGHGTGTGSCAVGTTVGFASGSLIWGFKCLGSDNTGSASTLITGMGEVLTHYNDRSATNRPAVLNMSLVFSSGSFSTAVAALIDAGVVVVACAGNSRRDLATITVFPAESDPDVLVVGGINAADWPYYYNASGSNWGARVDVSAASSRVVCAGNGADDAYQTVNGTSFGCGLTTGAVACMLQGHSRLTSRAEVQAVRAHVRATATIGRITNSWGITLPDRILYLNPDIEAPETIPGLG